MYTIKTRLERSAISGIGVFADEDVAEGATIWIMADGFDQVFAPAQFDALPAPAQAFLKTYAYLCEGDIILNADHGRFTNHADAPNTLAIDDRMVASRPIRQGEEITCDYFSFDDWAAEKLR